MAIANLIIKAAIWALIFGTFSGIRSRKPGTGVVATAGVIAGWIVGAFACFVLLDLVWNSIWPAIP